MNDNIKKLYDVLSSKGYYTKSFEDFSGQWSDEEYRKKVYGVVSRDGLYTKDYSSFVSKYSASAEPIKKKEPTASPSPSGQEPSSSGTQPKKPQPRSVFLQDAETGEKLEILTGYPGKEGVEYNYINGQWRKRKAGQTSWFTITNEGSISELNKFFNKQKTEDQIKKQEAAVKRAEAQTELSDDEMAKILGWDKADVKKAKEGKTKPVKPSVAATVTPTVAVSQSSIIDKQTANYAKANIDVSEGKAADVNQRAEYYNNIDLQNKIKEAGFDVDVNGDMNTPKNKSALAKYEAFTKKNAEDMDKKDKFLSSVYSIPEAIGGLNEEMLVHMLREKYKGTGFVFEETGLGNYIKISYAPTSQMRSSRTYSNTIEIPLGEENSAALIKSFMENAYMTDTEKKVFAADTADTDSYTMDLVSKMAENPYKYDESLVNEDWAASTLKNRYEYLSGESINLENLYRKYDEAVKDYNENPTQDKKAALSNMLHSIEQRKLDLMKEYEKVEKFRTNLDKVAGIRLAKNEKIGNTIGMLAGSLAQGMTNVGKTITMKAADALPYVVGEDIMDPIERKRLEDLGYSEAEILDQASKDMKRFIMPRLEEGIQNVASLGTTTQEYGMSEDRGDLAKAANFLAESIGTAISSGGNPMLQKIAFASMSYNAIQDQMMSEDFDKVVDPVTGEVIQEGLTEHEKELIAIPYAFVIGALEKLGWDAMSGKGILSKVSKWVIRKTLTDLPKGASISAIKREINKNVGKMVASGAIRIAIDGGLSEGAVEGIQQIAEIGMKNISNLITETDYFKNVPDLSTGEGWLAALNAAKEDAYYGALGGLMFSGIDVSRETASNMFYQPKLDKEFDMFYESIMNDDTRTLMKMKVDSDLAAGEISKEDAEQKIRSLDENKARLDKIPTDLSSRDKRESFNLLMEREKIEKQIAGKEDNLVAAQKARIAEINNELQTISQNAVQKQTTDESVLREEQPEVGLQEVEQGDTKQEVVTEEGQQEGVDDIEARRQNELQPVLYAIKASETTGEVPTVNGQPVNQKTVDDINAKYDTEIAAAAQPTTAEQIAPSLVTLENATEFERKAADIDIAEGSDRATKASRAAKSVLRALPGVEIHLHSNRDEFMAGVAKAVGRTTDGLESDFGADARGVFTNGEIHINLENATAATVFHEAFHYAFAKAGKTEMRRMANGIRKAIGNKSPRLIEYLDTFESQYVKENESLPEGQKLSDDQIAEEFITELGSILSDEAKTLDVSTLQKIANAINKIAQKIIGRPVLSEAASRQEIIDMMNDLSSKMRQGKKIDIDAITEDIATPGANVDGSPNIIRKAIDDARIPSFDTTPTTKRSDMAYPDKSSIEDVLEQSGGAAIFINSDATKVGEVEVNGRIISVDGGIDYTFIKKNVDDNIGFAASEDAKISVLNKIALEIAAERDRVSPEHKGKPVAVFVVAQNGETMLGEWYAAEYIMEGIDASITSKKYPGGLRAAKKDFTNAINSVRTGDSESGRADERAKVKLTEMIRSGMFDTHEGRIEMTKLLASKEFSFGFRVNLNKELIAANEKSWNAGKNRSIKMALAKAGHTLVDFWNKFMDERFLKSVNETKLAAEKGSAVSNKTISGFFYNPNVPIEQQVEHARLGIDHAQFNSSFMSEGNFLLDMAYDVNKLFPEMGYPTTNGIEQYNRSNGTSLGKKDMSIIDKLEVTKWLIDNGYKKLVVNPYSSISLSMYTGIVSKQKPAQKQIQKQISNAAIDKAREKYNLSIERGNSIEQAQKSAMSDLKKNEWYVQATDTEREDAVRTMRKFFGFKEKKAPSVGKILGKPKPEMIKMSVKSLRDEFIKAKSAEARNATMTLKQKQRQLVAMINEMKRGGIVTAQQASALAKRVVMTNVDNPIMVERMLQYAERLFERADYQEKLQEAKSLQKKIKSKLKSNGLQASVVSIAKDFSKIQPWMLSDIDVYIEQANAVLSAVRPSRQTADMTVDLRTAMSFEQVGQYVEEANKEIEEYRKAEILAVNDDLVQAGVISKDMNLKEILEIMNELKDPSSDIDPADKKAAILSYIGSVMDVYRPIVESMINGKDAFTGESVELTDRQKEVASDMLKIDVTKMDIRDAVRVIEAMDNFITNGIIDGVEAITNTYKGQQNAEQVASKGLKTKSIGAGNISRWWGYNMMSLPVLSDWIFRGTNRAQYVLDKMGVTDFINGVSKATSRWRNYIDEYHNEFNKKKANGKNFMDAENIYERGMYAFLKRTVTGDQAAQDKELKRKIKLIKDSVNVLREEGNDKDAKVADMYEMLIDKLGLNDENLTISDIEARVDKVNIDAVNWWINTWSDNYGQLADVSQSIYNTILDKDMFYTPDKFSSLDPNNSKAVDDLMNKMGGGGFANVLNYEYDKKTGVLMPSSKPVSMEQKRYVNLNFDNNNQRALKAALIDINTAAATKKIKGFFKSRSWNKIVSNKDDRDLFRKRVDEYILRARNKQTGSDDRTIGDVERSLRVWASMGATRALGSVFQPFKQTIPVFVNTLFNTGKHITFAFNRDQHRWIDALEMPISNRGIESIAAFEDADKNIDRSIAAGKLDKALEIAEKVNTKWLKLVLAKPDVFAARSSFIAYYKKALEAKGKSTDIDYSNPADVDQEALNYAQHMVDRQQNASDAMLMGDLFTSGQSLKKILKNTLFPFMSFVINQKSRMTTDFSIWLSKDSSKEDRKAAAWSLAGLSAEMAAFHSLSFAIKYYIVNAIASAIGGEDEPEEEDVKKSLERQLSYTIGTIAKDIFSPVPLFTDTPVIYGADWLMEKIAPSYMEDDAKEALKTENEVRELAGKPILEGKKAKDFIDKYIEERRYKASSYDSQGPGGVYRITLDKGVELYKSMNLAYNGEFETEGFGGKMETKYIDSEGKDKMKEIMPYYMAWAAFGIPAEFGSIFRKIENNVKKEHKLTEKQHEALNEVLKETGRQKEGKLEKYLVTKMRATQNESASERVLNELDWIESRGGLKNERQVQKYIEIFEADGSVGIRDMEEIQKLK